MEDLPAPLGVSEQVASVMAVDGYPVGGVDRIRLQRVVEVMQQFLGFDSSFSIKSMLAG